MINNRKFDLSFIIQSTDVDDDCYQKCGEITVQCTVIDDNHAFDYPAEFVIDHPEINTVVSYTATYTGQAISGERIEVAGIIEQNARGVKRIVVGSNREAVGEYIKVLHRAAKYSVFSSI